MIELNQIEIDALKAEEICQNERARWLKDETLKVEEDPSLRIRANEIREQSIDIYYVYAELEARLIRIEKELGL